NVVPSEITVDIDGRLVPGQEPRALIAELEARMPGVATYEIVRHDKLPAEAPDLSLYPMLADIAKRADPAGTPFPMLLPGATDGPFFRPLGIQPYGFLPMRLPETITPRLIHAADERVPVDAIQFGVDALSEVLRRYGSPGSPGAS